jgi:adenylate cyclase
MFTDMVGYTALGQRNESLSLALAEEQRKLIRPVLNRHDGREVKTMGDAFLVEFPSALDAVRCAYDIQRATKEFNISLAPEQRVHLRIGVHLGDIVESGGDISGDAVNVASRIESLAEAGGVCLTRQVYDHVHNKFELPLISLGGKSLKNVSAPIEVYRMVMPWESAVAEGANELDRHRVAVLPLSNISPDRKDAYFADGMTEELITVLSQVQGLRVIARTSVDRYSKRDKTVAQIARELRVGSVMEGSVRMAGDRIRVTVQLINGRSEEHLWSEKYDRKLDDIFEIQTDIAKQVANSLRVKLLPKELDRMESRAPLNTSAYSAYLKGRALLVSRTEADLKAAKELFESAIAMDPIYSPAYSGLADAYIFLADYSSIISPSIANREARGLVSKALEINPDLAEARATLGLLLAQEYDFAGAEKELRRSISLNPSYSNAHFWFGQFVLAEQGRYRECLEELNLAELADPLSIAVLNHEFEWLLEFEGNLEQSALKLTRASQLYPDHQTTRGMNVFFHIVTGKYSRAIELSLAAIGHDEGPGANFLFAWLVVAYSAIGNREEARKWLARLETLAEGTPYRSVMLSLAYGGLGEANEFLVWARRAIEEKAISFGHLRLIDKELPALHGIREDPRFVELFKKVGLDA